MTKPEESPTEDEENQAAESPKDPFESNSRFSEQESFKKKSSKSVSYGTEDFLTDLGEESPSQALCNLDDDELMTTVKDLERKLKRLLVENQVFYRFLMNNDPESIEEKAPPTQRKVSILSGRISISLAKPTSLLEPPKTLTPDPREKDILKINITQKSDLVMRDMEDNQATAAATKKKLLKLRFSLIAHLEEAETRRNELENSLQSFELFKESCDSFEKFTRFMVEWSKRSRLMADKTRLRYSSLRVQYQKLSTMLAHKQLIGENLQEIDFEQLRIENLHLVENIENKSLLLIELKKMTAENSLKLSQHKKLLQEKVIDKETIVKAIKNIEKDIEKSDEELSRTVLELNDVKEKCHKWRNRICKFKAPKVIEYVKKKEEVDNLKKELKIWGRQKEVKELALSIKIGLMKKLLHCQEIYPCWFE